MALWLLSRMAVSFKENNLFFVTVQTPRPNFFENLHKWQLSYKYHLVLYVNAYNTF
jgi:hypothetical protein